MSGLGNKLHGDEDYDVHVVDDIVEDSLNIPEGMPEATDQHDPLVMIKESDRHVHVADDIIEDSLDTPEGMPEGTDQHNPLVTIKESDRHVHVADDIIEDSLNTSEGMPEGTDQYDPPVMIEESDRHPLRSKWNLPISIFFKDARHVFRMDELGREIMGIAFPAILALVANPVASIIHTAFIRCLGTMEVAAVEVSITGFNQAINIIAFALASITTSFVAKEKTRGIILADLAEGENSSNKKIEMTELARDDERLDLLERCSEGLAELTPDDEVVPVKGTFQSHPDDEVVPVKDITVTTCGKERQHIPSASVALLVAGILGVLLTASLTIGAETLLAFMGVTSGSPILIFARRYLKLRSLGAPAVLLSFAMQGVFQGFKDTRTPLYAIVAGELANIALDLILIFAFHLGVSGAAIAYALSQYIIFLILLRRLMKQVDLLPSSLKNMHFRQFLKNGLLMLVRGVALTCCSIFAALLVARLSSTALATFLICLKVWTMSSLISGGLAVAGQAILVGAFAEKDYDKVIAAASRVLQMGFVLGLGLSVIVAVGLKFASGVLSEDVNVQQLIFVGMPFVAAIQPINCMAFVFDGITFGASDFAYSAYSMILVSIISIASLFLLSKSSGFVGIWVALTIYMGLRTIACILRLGTGTGPWRFLRGLLSHQL